MARAALGVLRDEGLVERAAELGEHLIDRLRQIRSPLVRAVRGRGLLVGIELVKPARATCEALKAEGLLCKETHDTVIRLAPPLVISREDLDWAIERITRVLTV